MHPSTAEIKRRDKTPTRAQTTICLTIISFRLLPICIARQFAALNTTCAADYTPISLRTFVFTCLIELTPAIHPQAINPTSQQMLTTKMLDTSYRSREWSHNKEVEERGAGMYFLEDLVDTQFPPSTSLLVGLISSAMSGSVHNVIAFLTQNIYLQSVTFRGRAHSHLCLMCVLEFTVTRPKRDQMDISLLQWPMSRRVILPHLQRPMSRVVILPHNTHLLPLVSPLPISSLSRTREPSRSTHTAPRIPPFIA